MKNAILSLSIIAILTICMFNSVAAAPVSKLTPDIHSNYARDLRGGQQTYIILYYMGNGATTLTMGVGQYTYLYGILADTPPANLADYSHGLANKTVNIQTLSSDGKTWSTVYTYYHTLCQPDDMGAFMVKLAPTATGVYTYRVTFDSDIIMHQRSAT